MEDVGLYLQDFVSSLDNLPSEVQHLFTELRAHEQEFQLIRRGIHQREKTLQSHLRAHGYAADQAHPQEEQLMTKCHSDFEKAQEVADEKIALSQKALDLVQRYIKKLDGDLKRHEQEEKHARGSLVSHGMSHKGSQLSDMGYGDTPGYKVGRGLDTEYGTPSPLSRSTGRTHGGATLKGTPRPQKRKHGASASGLKDLLNGAQSPFAEGTSLAGGQLGTPTPQGATATQQRGGRGYKKLKGNRQSATAAQTTLDRFSPEKGTQGRTATENVHFIENIEATPGVESDEPLYCICQQVSYGDMVACDGENCPHEWFHYECVGLTSPPQGTWYCADCLASRKIRK